jgi:superfamily I DNA/RNA helicase
LTYKIAYLIRGKKIPVNKILAVTFTNKAANEMKERLLKISDDISKVSDNNILTDKEGTNNNDSIDNFLESINTTSTIP